MEQEIITISNYNTTVVVAGYAYDGDSRLVWLDLAPDHPKKIGAIWAELVSGTPRKMNLQPGYTGVCGMGSAYIRLTADAPDLVVPNAANVKPRFLRLVHPRATRAPKRTDDFKLPLYVFPWPGMTAGRALAAVIERDTPYPCLLDWGDRLLDFGIERGIVHPLTVYGTVPQGYEVELKDVNLGEFIAEAVRQEVVCL
jgi:hypothetical protein